MFVVASGTGSSSVRSSLFASVCNTFDDGKGVM